MPLTQGEKAVRFVMQAIEAKPKTWAEIMQQSCEKNLSIKSLESARRCLMKSGDIAFDKGYWRIKKKKVNDEN
jgi:hypothetical protein